MTTNIDQGLVKVAKEMLFNWFSPGRASFLFSEAHSITKFLELKEPPEGADFDLFYEDQIELQRAQFLKEPKPGASLLDENLSQLCKLLHFNFTEHQILRYLCIAEAFDEFSKLTTALEHKTARGVAAQIADCLQLPAATVFPLLNQNSKLIQSGLVHKQRFYPGGRSLGGSFSIVDSELAFHLIEGQFDFKQVTTNLGIQGKAPHLDLNHFDHIQQTLDVLIPYLKRSLQTGRKGVNILIHGIPGTGKTELGRVLGQHLECGTFEPSFQDDEGDPISGERRFSKLRCTLSFLKNEPTLVVCDEAEDLFQKSRQSPDPVSSHKLWINRLLEENEIPVIWLSNSIRDMDPANLRRFDFVFELSVPSRTQRQKIIQDAVGDLVSDSLITNLATHEGLAPAVISRAAGVLQEVSSNLPASSRDQAFQLLVSQTLKAQGHSVPLATTPNNAVAYDPQNTHASVDLHSLIAGLRIHGQARICLEGPPGTGKTAFGTWLAESLNLPLHPHRVSDLSSMLVGQTEKAIAKAFQKATEQRSILMLDEVDSLLADRSGAFRSWEVSQVNEMLTQMESFQGILIATTNRMNSLDAAGRRRFDLTISLDYLTPSQIDRLFSITCDALGLPESQNPPPVRDLVNVTPGDFAALTRQHRFKPFPTSQALADALVSLCLDKKDRPSLKAIGFKAI